MVAKLLFMAKRARPDLLTVVSFLCMRVQGATQQDLSKLERILGYMKATQDHVLVLHAQTMQNVRAYIYMWHLHYIATQSHTQE